MYFSQSLDGNKKELKEGVLPTKNLPLKFSKTPEETKEPCNTLSIEKRVLATKEKSNESENKVVYKDFNQLLKN